MKSCRIFCAALIAVFISSAARFAYAEEKIKPADVQGASTDAKYIEIHEDIEAAAEVGVYNAFISRGQVNNDEPVVQPQIEITKYGVYLNVWGNLDLTDRVTGRRDFSEVDLTLGYKLLLEQAEIRLGIIDYIYPNRLSPETREVFGIFEYPNSILTPRVECYYDFVKANGIYAFLALEHEFSFLNDKMRLTPGVSSGWGSCPYNNYYFRTDKSALNDGNVYTELEYDLTKVLTFGVSAAYMWLYDADIRDGAHGKYLDTKHWTFGVKLTYEM
jgi:hypothetical protein